jgi:hypothetical protein
MMLRISTSLYLTSMSIWLAGIGCSAPKDSSFSDAGLTVPECEAYAAKVASCFHREDARASVVTVAATPKERDDLARGCTANLQRLNGACR